MNILFWADGFWPRIGGIETQGFQLVKGMQARGHQLRVLAQRDDPSWKEDEIYEGIPIQRFDFNAIVTKRDLKTIRLVQDHLEWILKEFRPDRIHLNASIGASPFVFLLFKKMLRMPMVLTAHAPYCDDQKAFPLIEKIASSADGIGCVSNWVFKEMETHFPTLKDKLRLIYNGLPMPNITPTPLPFSPPTLLLFGRLAPEKGFEYAIKAFSLLKKGGSEARLIVAGGGPERQNLEKWVSELGISQSVQFRGVLSPDAVFSTFNEATLVIVPSIIESFGLVILEAMQMGRPVIASRVEGVPEVVSEGETGLLVPPRDPMALSEAIQTLLNQPERAIQMGIEGRKRAMAFPLKLNVDQFEQLYKVLRTG